ncbi:hypothetical protein Cme02nite_00550 [Catellatospora methionotrophica]|uniref:OmpR/PhoB-type domain-containing protein n=2 Tax=Catellatospora methionotrophica TaxID=121620 RepID=A0A8J3KZP7_9ACTN|nr:hypothetical protein Cme02nite_00550 [Catellatospora methionotrophica]
MPSGSKQGNPRTLRHRPAAPAAAVVAVDSTLKADHNGRIATSRTARPPSTRVFDHGPGGRLAAYTYDRLMVRVAVLGTTRALRDGPAVDIGGPRQRAVLARLVAAGGQVVATDRLIDDLWGGEPPPKALAALQVYVSHLRRALEPGRPARSPATILISAAPGYALRLPVESVDVWRFEALTADAAACLADDPGRALGLLDAALSAWDGTAFEEFADEDWAAAEARRLEQTRLDAVEQRAVAAIALGQPARVVAELDGHVRAHPLREQAVHALATALYQVGRQADALAVLRTARDRLDDELGVEPGPALRELEVDVLRQAPHLRPVPARAASAGPVAASAAPPLPEPADADGPLGRDREYAQIAAAAEQALRSGPQIVWLAGEPGAGKSTLADHASRRLAASGWHTAWARCPEVDGAPPAWAWGQALRTLLAAVPAADPQRLAPLVEGDGTGDGGQFRMVQAVSDYLRTVAADAPLLIVVDDVHRADGETLQLLRHVANTLADRPLLLLAAYRPAEATDELTTTRAVLAHVAATDLTVSGLGADAVAQLLARHGARVDADTAHRVWERTSGNPLFVTQTARLIAAEGAAAADDAVPAGIRHVLHRRLARLPATAQTVLRHAAVLGRDVDVDVLLAMDATDDDTVLDGLEGGVLAGLLVEPSAGRVRFAHALLRDTLYTETPLLRRGRLHGRALQAMRRLRPHDTAALGRHALAAAGPGGSADVIRFAVPAARQAAHLFAPREAARLWAGIRAVLDQGGDPSLDADRLDVLCGLASALGNAGDVLGARAVRQDAVDTAARLGGPDRMRRALTSMDAPVTWTIRQDRRVDTDLVATIEQALADDRLLPAERSALLSTLVFEVEGDDNERARIAGQEALELAETVGDPHLLCLALNACYFVALVPDRQWQVPEVGERLLAVSTQAGLLNFQTQAHHVLYGARLCRHDFAAARAHVQAAIASATTGQLGLTLAVMSLFEAVQALWNGDFAAAERQYTEIAQQMERGGAPNAVAIGVLGRFAVRLGAGRVEQSAAEFAPFHETVPEQTHDLYARSLLAAGQVEQARRVWRPWLPLREDYFWLFWATVRGQNAVLLGDLDAARASYAQLGPWSGRYAGLENGSIVAGPVDDVLGDLAALLGRPGEAARHHAQARLLAEQTGCRAWRR